MINHPNSRLDKANYLPLKQMIKSSNPCFHLESHMRTYSIYFVLCITTFLTTITTNLLSASSNVAIAQTSFMSESETLGENSISQVNVLFVNPSIGNDTNANGEESNPLKTITKALQIAKNGAVIRLAPGTYSAETGESFPLILKGGVSIQGNTRSRGKDIVIQGGGEYLSRYYGSKNIAIVAAGKTKLAGVTVTNTNRRGYGLWIESNQPVVEKNTFANSTQDGVAVMGTAAPQISNNYFYRNGANGITVSGTSQPRIEQNTFQETGFGVNIAQSASPQVIGNKISHNRSGIVVQAASSPVLRNNSIVSNKEDGLVVIAKAIPDLGNSSNPGGNQFRFNGRYDINAKAAKQEISAYGNSFTNKRIVGKVNVTASAAPVKAAISPLPRRTPKLLNPRLRGNTSPKPPINNQQQFNYLQVQPDTIEFTAPGVAPKPTQIPANTPSSLPELKPAPVGESALLSVPPSRIPFSNNGKVNMQAPRFPSNSPSIQNPSQTQARTTQTDLRYRVIVEAVTSRQQELVKYIVPDAFRTRRRGRRVMQAGIFSNRTKANQLITIFQKNGLKARIENW